MLYNNQKNDVGDMGNHFPYIQYGKWVSPSSHTVEYVCITPLFKCIDLLKTSIYEGLKAPYSGEGRFFLIELWDFNFFNWYLGRKLLNVFVARSQNHTS